MLEGGLSMRKISFLTLIGLAGAFVQCAAADGAVTVTTGAGYIPVVKQIVNVCKARHNAPAAESYGGNIGQMLAQITAGSGVNVVVTDKTTIERIKTQVRFSVRQPLGTTPLALVWKKGLTINKPEDIAGESVQSIAIPDPKAAVYGRAGSQWISGQNNAGLSGKLMQVASVPQVASYVARGEVDAGFVNVQAARKGLKNFGGMLVLHSGYDPIELQALVVEGYEKNPSIQKFLTCLRSPEIAEVLVRSGIAPAADAKP